MKCAVLQALDISGAVSADMVAQIAQDCLIDEVRTWPKPV